MASAMNNFLSESFIVQSAAERLPRRDRAFNAYGGFTSGTNVHYPPSAIVSEAYQHLASNLIIGERMLPHVFICAADARPFDIQDFLPADTRFKILAFLGDISNGQQFARMKKLADDIVSPKNFYRKFGSEDPSRVFDIVSIGSGRKDQVNYTDVPLALRTHWSKYVDSPYRVLAGYSC